jgi:hypothetical protein
VAWAGTENSVAVRNLAAKGACSRTHIMPVHVKKSFKKIGEMLRPGLPLAEIAFAAQSRPGGRFVTASP